MRSSVLRLRFRNFKNSLLLLICLGATAVYASAQDGSSSSDFTKEKIYSSEEVTKPAVVTEKPKVDYRKDAGEKDVDGVIVISLVLASTGKVTNVQIAEGLSTAQNSAAIKAARLIKFMPAVKNGEPVSQSLTIEYPFRFRLIEVGTVSELRGISKVFIDTGGSQEERLTITGEVLKYLPKLTIVDVADDAEVILAFHAFDRTETVNYSQKDIWAGDKQYSFNVNLEMEVGQGMVLRRVSTSRFRALMEFADQHRNKLERKPSTNFARAFVKVYKQENGIVDE